MLGYISQGAQGQVDQLLAKVAADLHGLGASVAGVVQVNEEFDPSRPCHMDLHIITGGEVVRISQNLGALSKGCRLDPAGLEQAVGLVARALDKAPRLLIINKFGKTEGEGRGFRPLIGQAMAAGIPVLTAVSDSNFDAFTQFADGLAEALPRDYSAVLAWCQAQLSETT